MFKRNYDQLNSELKTKSPQADLFLIIEPPVQSSVENNRFLPYRKIILDLGQKYQLQVIDDWNTLNSNGQGKQVFADTVGKGLEKYLTGAY